MPTNSPAAEPRPDLVRKDLMPRPVRTTAALVASAPLSFAGLAIADTFTATFTGGAAGNLGNWTYGLPPVYPASGGNPGQYLLAQNLDGDDTTDGADLGVLLAAWSA